MPTKTQTLVIGTFALLSVSGLVLAQTAPAGSTATTTAASAQIPTQQGQLKQFLLNPRGDIDGLILADGTEVNTPPHLSEQLAATFKPGDSINVAGLRAASLPLVQAVSLTNVQTGKTVTDEGPDRVGGRRPPAPPAPPAPGAERDGDSLQGQIVQLLHGPRGDVNGALLQDGTALRLPPHEALRLQALLKTGQNVAVRGELVANAQGRAFRVSALGADANSLQTLDTPPAPRGPGRLPPPPPPGVQPVAPGAQPPAPPAPPAG